HRRLRDVTRHTFELEHDAARLHDRHPRVRRSLALTHADFRRLLGDRLVREDPDPDLAATLDVTGHGDTRRLDLAARYPARLLRRQTEGPERHGVAAARDTGHAALEHLAKLYALGTQHRSVLLTCRSS